MKVFFVTRFVLWEMINFVKDFPVISRQNEQTSLSEK